MFEREPNIDIVFRNGLKNMEVLPPADVWDNIPPMPMHRSPLRVVLRVAAGVAVLVSMTLATLWYLRSNNTADTLNEAFLAANDRQPENISSSVATPAVITSAPVITHDAYQTRVADREPVTAVTGPSETPVASMTDTGLITPQENNNVTVPLSADDVTVIVSRRLKGVDDYTSPTITSLRPEASEQRFLVGASVSPAMGFSSAVHDTRIAELVSSEKARPSYTTGLSFGYKISPRLTINSGIGLASMGQTITGIDVFAGLSNFYSVKGDYLYSVETASGTIRAGNTDLYLTDSKNRVGSLVQPGMADPSKYHLTQVGSDIHQVFRYLELPVLVRYKVIDRRIALNLSGGMAYGFLIDNFAYTRYGSELIPVGHTEGISMHSLSSQLGLGMEYNISSNISFNFEPVIKYYVTPLSDIAGTLYRPYSFGFFSGLFFKF
jgi:hypothetical protein